jgi:hypothetical protein
MWMKLPALSLTQRLPGRTKSPPGRTIVEECRANPLRYVSQVTVEDVASPKTSR